MLEDKRRSISFYHMTRDIHCYDYCYCWSPIVAAPISSPGAVDDAIADDEYDIKYECVLSGTAH
jgi:hypothetical protein